MANHITTGAAGGALKGGMLGAVLGFFTIPVLVASGVGAALALGAIGSIATASATGGIAWGAVAGWSGLAALVTTFANSFIPSPINNLAMAAYGAAGFGLFGAVGGAEHGMQQNVQDQARSTYINAYAQTRAGLEQQMQQAAYMEAMQAEAAAVAPSTYTTSKSETLTAANQNVPQSRIDAATIESYGKQHHAAGAAIQA